MTRTGHNDTVTLGDGAPTLPDREGLIARQPATWAMERFVAALATCGFVSLLYYPVARLTADRHYELATSIDAMIPFVPETVWMYFPGYIGLLLVGAFGVRNRNVYYRTILSVCLASVICVIGFLLVPSTMAVPKVTAPDSPTMHFLAWVQRIDVPNNTFPSQHVALSFCVAFGALLHSRRLGLVILTMALGVAAATMTTKQHYWVDSPGGILVALLAHWVLFRVRLPERLQARGA